MKCGLVLVGCTTLLTLTPFASASAQNAALIQPRSYRVVLENDRVRVLDYNALPGMGVCGTGLHSHPDHVTVLLSPAKVRVIQNGRTTVVAMKAGDSFYEPAVTHEVENLGSGPVRSLIVELKSPADKRQPLGLSRP